LKNLSWPTLIVAYFAATALQGTVGYYAYLVPGLTQPILALRFVRLGIVFLIIAVLAYALGARGVAGMSAGVGRTLLFVFLVLAVIFAIVGIMQSA
jgi:uncharacterized membrane protein YtjA (UPF0391 family)